MILAPLPKLFGGGSAFRSSYRVRRHYDKASGGAFSGPITTVAASPAALKPQRPLDVQPLGLGEQPHRRAGLVISYGAPDATGCFTGSRPAAPGLVSGFDGRTKLAARPRRTA